MVQKNPEFFCIGACHIDIKARALVDPVEGESIPVTSLQYIGGVATNIALNLKAMGAKVALCSYVGHDENGRWLRATLAKNGIDIEDLLISQRFHTALYHALLRKDGDLFIASADMAIYEEIQSENIKILLKKREAISHVVVDANISDEALHAIANAIHKEQYFFGIGVSSSKANRLRKGFPRFDGLFLNRRELFCLTGQEDIKKGMRILFDNSCFLVVVTDGAQGIYYSCEREIFHQSSVSRNIVDVTGSGDALASGVIFSLSQGYKIENAIERGIEEALRNLSSPSSSRGLS